MTAKLTGKFLISPDSAPHLLGDLTITRNGDVYASDSRAPIVWKLRAGGDTLERFVESPLLLNAQGLTFTPDEKTLYLADYSRGMLKIDPSSRSVRLLPCRDQVLALGITRVPRRVSRSRSGNGQPAANPLASCAVIGRCATHNREISYP